MLKSMHRRTVRRSLALTTALAGGCLIAGASAAQSLPTPGDATTAGLILGLAPVITPAGTTLNVDLRAVGTIIDWDGFNVPGGSTIAFNDARVLPIPNNIAVLNRDVSGTSSTINGAITSDPNVAVWIYNSHGILIGGGSQINTGSLVLTTLEPNQNDFLLGNGYRLAGASNLTNGITVQTGARISVQGGNRGLILVAPKIESNGILTATDQDVAFVTATDVTLNYNTGSPLSVVLHKGTSVGGASQIVRGKVSGQNVIFALASRASVTDALLNISAEVSTASSSDRGIVLVAGKPSSTVGGVTIGNDAADTGGVVDVAVSNTLTSAASNTDVIVAGSGDVSLARALLAGRDVKVAAGGLASVADAVTAGRDYAVTGIGVKLGGGTAPLLQQAVRDVSITADNGNLTGLGALTLLSDSNGNNNGALTLATTGTSAGDIMFGPSTHLRGGSDGETDVRIRVRSAANAITLGDVTGGALLGTIGTAGFTTGLSVASALNVGDLDIGDTISLKSAALTAGNLESGGAITLNAGGALTASSIDARGSVTLSGTWGTTIGGIVAARDSSSNIQIMRTGGVAIGGAITAGRDLTIGSTATPTASISTSGALSARNISLVTTSAQALNNTITARGTLDITAGTTLTLPGVVRATGSISLRAAGIQLVDVTSTDGTLTALAGAGGLRGTTIAGARLGAENALTVTATGGALDIAQGISDRSTVSLTGTGIVARILGAGGDVVVDGGQSAVTLPGAVTAGGAYRVTGGTVTLGGTGTVPVIQAANGLVTVIGGAGGITGVGELTVRSNSDGAGTEALTLAIVDTAPNGAIAFSTNSTLLGGTARQSDVQIRSGSSDSSVTLGNVVARGLLGAVATGGFGDGLVRNRAIKVGNVRLSRALLLNGTGVSAGNLLSDAAISVISAGQLSASSIDAGGNLVLSGTGDTMIGGLVQTRGAGRNITIDRDGDLRIGSLQAGGAVAIGGTLAPASLDIGATASGDSVAATTTGAQLWRGAVQAGGAVTLSGESLSTRDVRSSSGAITLTSTTGGLNNVVIDGSGLVTLTSAGALTASSVRGGAGVRGTATGAVNIAGTVDGGTNGVILTGQSLGLAAVRATGGVVTLTSTNGALQAGAIDGSGLTTLNSSGALTAAAVRGGAGVQVTTAGNLTIGGLVNGGVGGVSIIATAGAAGLTGGVSAGGDYNVTAQTVTLGGTQSANGSVAIRSIAGALTGRPGLILTANANGVGNEALTLDAIGGGIALNANSVLNGGLGQQSAVMLHSDGPVTLGAVNARALAINDGVRLADALTTGNLTLTQGLTLLGGSGGINTGAVTIGSGNLAIDAQGGAVATGIVAVGGAVTLTGSRVDFSRITGTAVTLRSTGVGATGITGGDITANGAINLTAIDGSGGITAGALTTNAALTISSAGTVLLGSAVAGATATIATSTSPADILIAGGLTAGDTIRLTSAHDIRTPFIKSINGALFLLAPNGSLTGFAPGTTTQLTAGAGSGLTLDIGDAVRLGALTGGPILLRANSIEIDSIDVGNNLVDLLTDAGSIDINGGIRGGTVTLASTGTTSIAGPVVASGVLTLLGTQGLNTGALSGSSVSLMSGGVITTGAIVSGGALNASGTRVTLGAVTANGLATLAATGGPLSVDAVTANGGLDARSTGDISVASLTASGGAAAIVSTLGNALLGATMVSGNLAVQATGTTTLIDTITAGGDYTVRGASIALGGAGVTQRAGGQIVMTSTSGAIAGSTGLALLGNIAGGGSTMLIDSAGQIGLSGTIIDNNGGALGLRAGSGNTVTFGTIKAGSIGGIAPIAVGGLGATATFQHDAAFTAGDIVAGDIGIVLSAGPLVTGMITTSGATRLMTTGTISTNAITAATIDINAGAALTGGEYRASGAARIAGGSIALDRLVAGGTGTIASQGALRIDSASAAALTITATGDLTGRTASRAVLNATAGNLSVEGGALVRLGTVDTAGQALISGTDIDMAGGLTAARAALIKARNALTVGDVTAGGALTLDAGGMLSARALRSTGDALVSATGNAGIASLDTNGALTVRGANVTLGTGRAGGAALIEATGLATLGQLVAGPAITISATDAAIIGAQRATAVAFENLSGDTTVLRLGDTSANDGFRLSDAEIKLVESDTLTFRQGSGAVEIGTLAFDADAGRRSVDILGTGAIAVRGVVSGAGAGRRFRLGGDAADTGMAREINVVATSTAGGRLLFDTADLELRGSRIAVGVAPGFIDGLNGVSFDQVITGFVGNANSPLYNANIGGGFYDAAAPTTVAAHSLTVRYGDYALFQNTGAAGQSSGVVLGGTPGAPVSPTLTLLPASADTNAFAFFGTINGINGTSAALLGSGVVSLGNANLATTRINGCLVGSGAGCLAAIVIQPTLQVFETTQQDVFGSVETLDVPFDPVVSGSNEELLTGLATLGPRAACDEGDAACAESKETPK
ncbi:filamentous hemagglutinin family protein [Sphingomonas sp. UYAg733]